MMLGNKKIIFYIFFLFINSIYIQANEKIITSPLINLNKIKPSFEEVENSNNISNDSKILEFKKKNLSKNKKSRVKFIGLDKITAKTSEIIINLGEVKKFGSLEMKVLKCGKVNSENINDNVAYLQVKDLSKNRDEKIFIFNGWTFSLDPSFAPFDHAIYDLQLVNCNNV